MDLLKHDSKTIYQYLTENYEKFIVLQQPMLSFKLDMLEHMEI